MPVILLIIGVVLVVYNYRAIKKKSINFEIMDRTKSFQSVLNNNKEELDDYKIEIGALRKNLAESLTELQEEIFDIKKELYYVKSKSNLSENKNDNLNKEENIFFDEINSEKKKEILDVTKNVKNNDIISEINFNNIKNDNSSDKTKLIAALIEKNMTDDEICHELSIGKGEVLLVRKLFKK